MPAPLQTLLLDLFARHGCARVHTPILQPASPFLDLSGESIRRRLYLTHDADGTELCLRPEHTIPVGLRHLESGVAAADYCCLGPVFRQRAGEPHEFLQAGLESIGRSDTARADAEVLAAALEALALVPGAAFRVTLGDMGLLESLLEALAVAAPARRRLIRQLSSGLGPEAALAPLPETTSDYSGLLSAIAGQDPRAAKAFVEDVISIAGIATVGGRSAAEIAERFLSRAENRSRAIPEEARAVLHEYLAIEGGLGEAAEALRRLADRYSLALHPALALFEERAREIRESCPDHREVRFSARFARNMDYYTGFIFEVSDPHQPSGRPAVAGGRYDRLLQQLGSPNPVPAVGCAFWLDRLLGAAR